MAITIRLKSLKSISPPTPKGRLAELHRSHRLQMSKAVPYPCQICEEPGFFPCGDSAPIHQLSDVADLEILDAPNGIKAGNLKRNIQKGAKPFEKFDPTLLEKREQRPNLSSPHSSVKFMLISSDREQ